MFKNKSLNFAYWLLTLALFIAVIVMIVVYTPREKTMGDVQKIFYLHMPVAINTFLLCLVSFIASIGYLWQRKLWWDDLAVSAVRVAVVFCSVVLLTGMIWGKSAWGLWWEWTPRLTFSLVLWLLYVVYLIIRPSVGTGDRRAVVCAVYGLVAFLDVPLVYLSVKFLEDIHPKSITLAPEMKITLVAWFVPITMLAAGLLVSRFRLQQRESLLEQNNQIDLSIPQTSPAQAGQGGAI